MTCEEIYIQRIENGIRGIRLNKKTPEEANVGLYLNKLKPLNLGMYDDLLQKYSNVIKDYNKKSVKVLGK